MNDFDYPHEIIVALITAIPEDVYSPCPCGCGKKWKFIKQSPDLDEHCKRFCDNYKKQLTP